MEENNTHDNALPPHEEELIITLREMLEKTAGRKMSTPRDFDFLSEQIFSLTHQMVNSSTLKRLYGYIGNVRTPRRSTLDILCQFVGYSHWEAFVAQKDNMTQIESNTVVSRHLYTHTLNAGHLLRILWQPDRAIVARYDGEERFTIVEAANSKLQVGCTFRCSLFIQGEPLFLSDVTGLGDTPVNYVCGKTNGVQYF